MDVPIHAVCVCKNIEILGEKLSLICQCFLYRRSCVGFPFYNIYIFVFICIYIYMFAMVINVLNRPPYDNHVISSKLFRDISPSLTSSPSTPVGMLDEVIRKLY